MKYQKGDELVVTKEFVTLVTPFQHMRFSEGQGMVVVEPIEKDMNGDSTYLIRCRNITVVIDKETIELATELSVTTSNKQYSKIIATGLTFGQAMDEMLLRGNMVTRKEWGGYWYREIISYNGNEAPSLLHHEKYQHRVIMAKLKNGGFAVASPYQEDMLAMDWMVVQ